jgi:hypothetical protein
MKLWEINKELESCIDMETGEIVNEDKLHSLQMDRKEKLRNIALLALNKEADAKALKEQEDKFRARRKAAEKTAAWCRATLELEQAGQSMDEPEFRVSYRKSQRVLINDYDFLPAEFMKPLPDSVRESLVNKKLIADAIKAGKSVPGAELETRNNICIR